MKLNKLFCFHNYELKKEKYLYSKRRLKIYDDEIWQVYYDYYLKEYKCKKCGKEKKKTNKKLVV